jgi:predicted TPR repeat methyltransferase
MPPLDLGQALAQAFAHLDAGRTADARRLARSIERTHPNLPGLPYLLGLLALSEGQGKKAAQHLAKALAQTPDVPPLLLAMARAQTAQDRLGVADRIYRRLIVLLPDLFDAHRELASLLLKSQRPDAAIPSLRRTVALRPADGASLLALGDAERMTGHLDAAALAFAAAVDADDCNAVALVRLASVFRRLKRPGEAADLARRAAFLDPDLVPAYLELGQAEREGGRLDEALQAFEAACRRDGAGLEALWLKAECLAALGRPEEAEEGYRQVLGGDPEDRFGASLALARLGDRAPPARAPAAFVQALFDQYADVFDQDLVKTLGYCGPVVLADAIARALGGGPFDCFDAGCGTGLAGAALKPSCRRLDGVDLSPRMAAKAVERGVYDRVDTGDLVSVLATRPQSYDLVVAADVLIYLGDLAPMFGAAAAALTPGGGFAFTVESGEGDLPILKESRRFAHSRAYLERLAGQAGFDVMLMEDRPVRRDRGDPVPGLVVVLKKTTA